MSGSIYKRCGCRDEAGKPLGAACGRLSAKGHGRWYFKADLALGPGGRRRVTRKGGFATKRDAEVALTDLLDRVNKRSHIDAGPGTVGAYLTDWLAGKAALRSTTARSYGEHLDLYLLPVLGHIRFALFAPSDVDALFTAMRQLGDPRRAAHPSPELASLLAARTSTDPVRPLSAARIRRVHATLRAAMNAAVRRRLIAYNPALHVELAPGARPRAVVWTPERTRRWRDWDTARGAAEERLRALEHAYKIASRRPASSEAGHPSPAKLAGELAAARSALREIERSYTPPKVAVWTPEQTGVFLDEAAADRLYALYHLIAFRGLRRGEGIGLPWDDVALERAELTVTWQIVQLGYATQTAAPKAESAGVVALDRQTVEVLRLHRRQQQREREAWGSAWTDTGLVFTREDGTALHPEYVSRHFARLVRAADVPPIRLHDLRHGAATLALAGGADLKVVSDMLRHSSITITADTYTSVLPDTARRAAEAAVAIVPRRTPVPAATDDEPAAPVPHRSHKAPNKGSEAPPKSQNRRSDGCAARDSNPEPAD
ncbi:MAG: site-specific integrase [Mycobacteriales bacterium]